MLSTATLPETPDIETASESYVLEKPHRTKWVLASTSALSNPQVPLDTAIRDFLRRAESNVVYVGRDGDRKVYRFE